MTAAICDVSGKGVAAALFMVAAQAALNAAAREHANVKDIARATNDALCNGNELCMFVTGWIAAVDTRTAAFEYVCAGHEPGLLRQRNGTVKKRLSSNGCGWVEARSAGRRGVLAVHLTGGGRGAPWPGVGRSGVAAGRPACQRATRVLRCAAALRVTHRPSLRSSSRYGPCGPAWTGASRPSTTTRKARRLAVRG